MILQALNQYYDRLAADPKQDIAPFGFRQQNISFCLVLSKQGQLVQVNDLRDMGDDGKPHPRRLLLPYLKTRTSGDWANFLWDNTGYVLGADSKTKPKKLEKRFSLFRELHEDIYSRCSDPGLEAVCLFLRQWNPAQATDLESWDDLCDSQVVFRLQGEEAFLHDHQSLRDAWLERIKDELDSKPGISLLSNQDGDIAVMHPTIQGVLGCNTTGAMIVSFNADAFTSYGKTKDNLNAPVSLQESFNYTTALNRLIGNRDRRVRIGDATTVFWTESPTPAENIVSSFFGGYVAPVEEGEDNELLAALKTFLDCLRKGKRDELAEQLGDEKTKYFILGLSPNASRISVRFWLTGRLGDFAGRLARHVNELDITGLPDQRPPTLRDLLRETAREAKDIPPLLEGGLIRAILSETDYPQAFYQAVLRRIATDRRITPSRTAAIKAVLIRNYGKEIPMSLDVNRPESAYHLGRWFAVLEKIQKEALGEGLNATIKDKFYTSASATPAAVFPRLIQLSQHHLRKMETPELRGLKITRERQAQEIADRLDVFPRQLGLEDQGLFHLGYYHQNRDLYTKKEDTQE